MDEKEKEKQGKREGDVVLVQEEEECEEGIRRRNMRRE